MPAPVKVKFQVGGIPEVKNAFKTVADAMVNAEVNGSKAADRETRLRIVRVKREVSEKEKLYSQLFAEADKKEKNITKTEEREQKIRAKAATQAEAAKERAYRKLEAEVERSEKAQTRTIDRETKKRDALAEKSRTKLSRGISGTVTGSVGKVFGGATSLAAGALALGGGFGIADAMRDQMASEKAAIALSNSAYLTPGQTERPKPKDIIDRSKAVEAEFNIPKEELMKGMQDYVALSSDYKGVMGDKNDPKNPGNLGFFAKLAKSQGADFGEVMQAAGSLKVQNPDMGDAEMKNIMLATIGQGKGGAVELKDLAHVVSRVTASSAMYSTEGGSQALNQQKLMGLAQHARKVTGSADDAATVIERLGSDMMSNKERILQATGGKVNVVGKDKMLKDASETVPALLAATGGDLGALKKMGIGKESMKLFESELATYVGAEKQKKGSGAGAVKASMKSIEGAGYTEEAMGADLKAVMASTGERFSQAAMHIRNILEDKLGPYLEHLADKLPALMPKIEAVIEAIGKFADWFLDNPIKGVGAVVLAAITKDLAFAGIGAAVKMSLETALKAGLSGSMSQATFNIPQVALLGAVALTAGAITMSLIDSDIEKKNKEAALLGGGTSRGQDAHNLANQDDISPEQAAKNLAIIQEKRKAAEQVREKIKNRPNLETFGEGAANTMAMFTGQPSVAEANEKKRQLDYKAANREVEMLAKAAQEAAANLARIQMDPNSVDKFSRWSSMVDPPRVTQ